MKIKIETLLVMLTYEHEDCIEISINSIKKQTHKNFKALVIDDASRDSTVQRIRKLIGDDTRFEIIENSSNFGVFKNFNYASNLAINQYDFDYFSFVSPDDQYSTNWLAELIEEFKKNPIEKPNIVVPLTEYRSPRGKYVTDHISIEAKMTNSRKLSLIFNRYGIAFHGLWSREVLIRFSNIRLMPIAHMFRCEVLMVATLLNGGTLRVIPKVLYFKNADKGTKYRYPNIPSLQKSELTFIEGLLLIPRFAVGLYSQKTQRIFLISVYLKYLALRFIIETNNFRFRFRSRKKKIQDYIFKSSR